jgi:hypothetical protein
MAERCRIGPREDRNDDIAWTPKENEEIAGMTKALFDKFADIRPATTPSSTRRT